MITVGPIVPSSDPIRSEESQVVLDNWFRGYLPKVAAAGTFQTLRVSIRLVLSQRLNINFLDSRRVLHGSKLPIDRLPNKLYRFIGKVQRLNIKSYERDGPGRQCPAVPAYFISRQYRSIPRKLGHTAWKCKGKARLSIPRCEDDQCVLRLVQSQVEG